MNHFLYIAKVLISLIVKPKETWKYLAPGKRNEVTLDEVQHDFYFPLLGFTSLMVFLCNALNGEATEGFFNAAYGMTCMVPVCVAYILGPYLAVVLLKIILPYFRVNVHKKASDLSLFVFYATGYVLTVQIIEAVFPSISFFELLIYYLVYIVWRGEQVFLDTEAWPVCMFSFFAIWLSPKGIILLLQYMQG